MWNKFHEGWKEKRGEEMAEKWRRRRAAADDRPVVGNVSTGRRTNRRQLQGKEKREERERECDGFLGLIGNDLSEAKTKLYIGEREREWRAKMK